MTVTAVIISNDGAPDGEDYNLVIEYTDTIDQGNLPQVWQETKKLDISQDPETYAAGHAIVREGHRAEYELETNWEHARQEGLSATEFVWLRNLPFTGDEYILKRYSNQSDPFEVVAMAHIMREYSNLRITEVTGLSGQARQSWKGDALAFEQAFMSYEDGHLANPSLYFFDGFPDY